MKLKKLRDLYISFFKIGGLTFGGGLAMLPMLQREVVEERHWCTEEEILDMYAIGQCTPGIIAVNTATYVGYKQAGFTGGVAGTLGVISPSIIIICLIASILQNFIHLPLVVHALAGIRVIVCALMLNTVVSMARKGIIDKLGAILFLVAFLLACFTPIPTAVIIILAGLVGIIAKKLERRCAK
ncbi:chromate transporter [Faecalicatena contorta]|uniref:chromate transporter n=1 Tax=Lachnospiraceae TaxID=186803 RepID=UPI001F32F413|nr:chromate transporter [Faecalicatena contorta]MCF2668770.1 chromate transporter [Faecalicatena contorta]MCI6120684.1 chromate transporter [Lachnospiraceae bacterium]